MWVRVALLTAHAAAAVLALPQRTGASDEGIAERLERLERGLPGAPVPATPSLFAPAQTLFAQTLPSRRVLERFRSGHGQAEHRFRDLIPLVECAGELACTAQALAKVTSNSDLWAMPGVDLVAGLIHGNATFAGLVACAEPSPAVFQVALEALPGPAPQIALVPGGPPPRRAAGKPWITLSPRAADALGGVWELLAAPMAALEARGNLTLALEVDVDDAWFLAGRRSSAVSAIHVVGEGRIIVNPRHASMLRAIAAANAGAYLPDLLPAPGPAPLSPLGAHTALGTLRPVFH